MKTSIDRICTEEAEAGGIYSGKPIKLYIPILQMAWMHAVLTCNRLAIFWFSISVKNFFPLISNTFELIVFRHKTHDDASIVLHTTTLPPRGRKVLSV